MKKSLVLGIAVAASFAFTEAAWVKSSTPVGGEQAKSISTLGSLLNERSLSAGGSIKLAAADSAKASLVGLVAESRAIGTHWKDANVVGTAASLHAGSTTSFEAKDLDPGDLPEGSTWSAILVAVCLVGGQFWRRSRRFA